MTADDRSADYTLSVRVAADDEADLLWNWDNDIAVRESSFAAEPKTRDEYRQWYTQCLNDPHSTILIGLDRNNKPVGRAYLELGGDRGVIHVAVAAEERGKGYSSALIYAATEYAFETSAIDSLAGYIKLSNAASIRSFQSAGYVQAGAAVIEDQEALVYEIKRGGV